MRFTCFLFSETEGTLPILILPPLFSPSPLHCLLYQGSAAPPALWVSRRAKSYPWISGPNPRKGREGVWRKKGCWKAERAGRWKRQVKNRRREIEGCSWGIRKEDCAYFLQKAMVNPCGLRHQSFSPGLLLFQFVPGPGIPPLGTSCFITWQPFSKPQWSAWGWFMWLPVCRNRLTEGQMARLGCVDQAAPIDVPFTPSLASSQT